MDFERKGSHLQGSIEDIGTEVVEGVEVKAIESSVDACAYTDVLWGGPVLPMLQL